MCITKTNTMQSSEISSCIPVAQQISYLIALVEKSQSILNMLSLVLNLFKKSTPNKIKNGWFS